MATQPSRAIPRSLRDKYYDELTINNAATLNPDGYRTFVRGALTLGGASAGTIARNGNAATNGGDGGNGDNVGNGGTAGTAGTAGAALADGYLKGAAAGKDGAGGIQGVAKRQAPMELPELREQPRAIRSGAPALREEREELAEQAQDMLAARREEREEGGLRPSQM